MKKIIIILSILLLSGFCYWAYTQFTYMTVIVRFNELEPFEKQMNVYFKGFKVGKTTQIYPNKEYTNTFLKLRLNKKSSHFPSNVRVNILKKKTGGYVNIVFPNDPSLKQLRNNDEIQGIISKDINSLLDGKFTDEDIEDIVDNADTLIESATVAVTNLGDIFGEIKNIISENKSEINCAIKNIAKTTQNLNNISQNLNEALNKEQMQNSVSNLETTSKNIKNITNQIDESTLPIVNCMLCETYQTTKNAKEITCGLKNTLKKRMGLTRILFGKPMSEE